MMFSSAISLQQAQRLFIIAPAFILYGYNQAGLSALLTLPDVIRLFPQIDTVNIHGAQERQNSTLKGFINATLMLRALLGALSCSVIGDRLGRRMTIFVGSCCAALGQILQCTAFSLAQSTVGRIILGLGVGQLSVIVPVWQAECSSTGKRGRQVITSGIFICWRIPLVSPILFSVVICLSTFTLPESPRWLVQRGRISPATEALAALNNMPSDHQLIRCEAARIEASLSNCPAISLRDLVGGNTISIYTTTIFQDNLHLQGDIPFIVAASALTWKFLCSFLSFAAVDRLGRRWILLPGLQPFCLPLTAAVFIFLFNLAYPIGFLEGNFLYCTEVAPAPLRAVMSSISTANHWMWNFIITMVTPVALSTIGWRYYIVFAATCACVPLVVLLFFPETMNRDLELIDGVFREAPTIWDIVPMARKLPQHYNLSARVRGDCEKAG
ncbi:sugar transporter [Aspergillus homomorphus CBS 101889]|uniref:Sugar transporter n=1 Tax=Aspergillus homomorphus (strain CBS 101889) TaxID=1450537 RepID=A0A395HS00_ASPHC|nr:sugar transporter [Aspergillus homomorphus CBS 101889]RAL10712.1 sugar transporter [Aspergillus homomorphus CBS 101889]